KENHMRWMGKIPSKGQPSKNGYKKVIRKRTAVGTKKMVVLSDPSIPEKSAASNHISFSKNSRTVSSSQRSRKKSSNVRADIPTSSPKLDKSQTVASNRNQNVFPTVLRRAQNCCELCGYQSKPVKEDDEALKPFYITPLASGGSLSIKNMVALCSECHRRLSADAQPSDLKHLKRKARGKIIRTIEIQRKPRW
ncbi:MAG: HNH endonuclease, partial [Desulfobacteraceae bacterium]